MQKVLNDDVGVDAIICGPRLAPSCLGARRVWSDDVFADPDMRDPQVSEELRASVSFFQAVSIIGDDPRRSVFLLQLAPPGIRRRERLVIGGVHLKRVLHLVLRLGPKIMSVHAGRALATTAVEARTIRAATGISDSALSKHLRRLADAQYISQTLGEPHGPGRPRTWVSLTERGRTAYMRHLAALQRLAQQP